MNALRAERLVVPYRTAPGSSYAQGLVFLKHLMQTGFNSSHYPRLDLPAGNFIQTDLDSFRPAYQAARLRLLVHFAFFKITDASVIS